MNIAITPAAEKFIRRMVRFGGVPGGGFRLAVSPGGCSGLTTDFSVEREPRHGEATLEVQGLKLFLPAESRSLLDGVTIDFADTPTESGLFLRDSQGGASACGSHSNFRRELVNLTSFGKTE